MKNFFQNLLALFIVLIVIVGIALIFSGCGTITKTKQNATSDSTGVSKATSTAVSKSSTEEKSLSTWWKDSYYQPTVSVPGPTNTVTNTNTQLQPIIIREGGTQVFEKTQINYDSLVKAKVDSAVKSHTAAFSNKTVEGVSFRQLVLACLVSTFLTLILVWLKSRFRIVKNV